MQMQTAMRGAAKHRASSHCQLPNPSCGGSEVSDLALGLDDVTCAWNATVRPISCRLYADPVPVLYWPKKPVNPCPEVDPGASLARLREAPQIGKHKGNRRVHAEGGFAASQLPLVLLRSTEVHQLAFASRMR